MFLGLTLIFKSVKRVGMERIMCDTTKNTPFEGMVHD